MSADMTPETWTTGEVVRAIGDIKKMLGEVRTELREQRGEYLPREVYASDQRSLAEYKADVAKDIVDLGAEQARLRRDVRDGQRWAVGISVSVAGVLAGVIGVIINATGLGA